MARESDYYVPEGCIDQAAFLIFDGTNLTDGSNVNNLSVKIDRDYDFVLRAVVGSQNIINPATGGIVLYNYSGSRAFSQAVVPMPNHYAVVPEKIYPRNGAIRFDLQNVLRRNTACATTIFYPQLAFLGVKRYRPGDSDYQVGDPQLSPPFDPSKFELRPWTYTLRFSLSWSKWIAPAASGIIDIPRRFVIPVQDYDFELHFISALNVTTGARFTLPDPFQMTLYDSSKRALSNLPVNLSYFDYNRSEYGNIAFPCPPLVYPVWTQITVDIWSLICNTDPSLPYSIELTFGGVNRIPKV